MKNSILVLLFLVCSSKVCAQSSPDSTCYGQYGNEPLDSFYFEHDVPHKLRLVIDTNFHGNVWQVGAVQKAGFSGAFSGIHALQTDTLNAYPIGNESAAVVYYDSLAPVISPMNYDNFSSLSFWHYYDTDTLTDSCILQVTLDSGKTWINALNLNGYFYYNGSLNNYTGKWTSNSNLVWFGSSNGWRKETVCAYHAGAKGVSLPRLSGFRFLFKSDSTETNRPGWMIDNIVCRVSVGAYGNVREYASAKQLFYPNPSANGIYEVDYPSQYVTGDIQLYNSFGQLVKSQPLKKQIDISQLPRGLYYYKILFDNTEQVFSGSIIYE